MNAPGQLLALPEVTHNGRILSSILDRIAGQVRGAIEGHVEIQAISTCEEVRNQVKGATYSGGTEVW